MCVYICIYMFIYIHIYIYPITSVSLEKPDKYHHLPNSRRQEHILKGPSQVGMGGRPPDKDGDKDGACVLGRARD